MPKAEKKKQQKIIQDRTFGLKNKNKSKTVQSYIKGVENTVKHQGKSLAMLEAEDFQRKKNKKKQQEQQALLRALYQDVGRLKDESEEEEEDPKNIVCPYFKQGLCQKGKKCIYSHDLTLDRTEEIDLYVDQRTQLIMNQIGTKNLNDISEDELNKMISDKEKDYIKGAKSEIVCKFFLTAVQKGKYGWNWACPNNGDSCKYKHCLPPGYVIDKGGVKAKVEQQINIEQKIDEQRNKLLSSNKQNPLVTYQVFTKWKEDRALRKIKQAEKKKKQQEKKNKNKILLRNGRQLFTYEPNLFVDDEQAADDYIPSEKSEDEKQQLNQQMELYQNSQEQDNQEKQEEDPTNQHIQKNEE